jgi:membrane protease YdiL (CAAX protease family)
MVDTVLVVCITVLITAIPLLPDSWAVVMSLAVVGATAIAWIRRCRIAAPLGLFCAVCLMMIVAGIRYTQVSLGAGLLAYTWATQRSEWLRGSAAWIKRGRLDTDVWLLVGGSAVIAAVALGAWYSIFKPDLTDIVEAYVPAAPVSLLILGGVLFSMLNAAIEEGAYRGVIQNGLEATLGVGTAALCLQAAAFGAVHMRSGFPRGWIGVGLASVYGLMMGVIRRRSDGMLGPWIAHVLTDVVIVSIILAFQLPRT